MSEYKELLLKTNAEGNPVYTKIGELPTKGDAILLQNANGDILYADMGVPVSTENWKRDINWSKTIETITTDFFDCCVVFENGVADTNAQVFIEFFNLKLASLELTDHLTVEAWYLENLYQTEMQTHIELGQAMPNTTDQAPSDLNKSGIYEFDTSNPNLTVDIDSEPEIYEIDDGSREWNLKEALEYIDDADKVLGLDASNQPGDTPVSFELEQIAVTAETASVELEIIESNRVWASIKNMFPRATQALEYIYNGIANNWKDDKRSAELTFTHEESPLCTLKDGTDVELFNGRNLNNADAIKEYKEVQWALTLLERWENSIDPNAIRPPVGAGVYSDLIEKAIENQIAEDMLDLQWFVYEAQITINKALADALEATIKTSIPEDKLEHLSKAISDINHLKAQCVSGLSAGHSKNHPVASELIAKIDGFAQSKITALNEINQEIYPEIFSEIDESQLGTLKQEIARIEWSNKVQQTRDALFTKKEHNFELFGTPSDISHRDNSMIWRAGREDPNAQQAIDNNLHAGTRSFISALSCVLENVAQDKEAASQLVKAIITSPNSPEYQLLMGALSRQTPDTQKAFGLEMDAYEHACGGSSLNCRPDSADYLKNLADMQNERISNMVNIITQNLDPHLLKEVAVEHGIEIATLPEEGLDIEHSIG